MDAAYTLCIPSFLYHIFIYSYIYIYIYFPIYLYTYIPIYLYTYIPICLYTYIPIYLYTYIPIYLYTYIPNIILYIFIHITCIYIYIYISWGKLDPHSYLILSFSQAVGSHHRGCLPPQERPGITYNLLFCLRNSMIFVKSSRLLKEFDDFREK